MFARFQSITEVFSLSASLGAVGGRLTWVPTTLLIVVPRLKEFGTELGNDQRSTFRFAPYLASQFQSQHRQDIDNGTQPRADTLAGITTRFGLHLPEVDYARYFPSSGYSTWLSEASNIPAC